MRLSYFLNCLEIVLNRISQSNSIINKSTQQNIEERGIYMLFANNE